MPFVLASNNAGKLGEFSVLFDSMGLDVVAQRDFGVVDAEETGLSFIENALIKARHAATETNLPAIADDSGLVVPALGGEPGIYSARYSGMGDIENNKIPKNVKGEFEKVCTESFAKDIKIDISHSTKKGGPLFIKEQEDIVKQNAAEKNIKNNDSIKDFMNRFDATLKDKSIKPTN